MRKYRALCLVFIFSVLWLTACGGHQRETQVPENAQTSEDSKGNPSENLPDEYAEPAVKEMGGVF